MHCNAHSAPLNLDKASNKWEGLLRFQPLLAPTIVTPRWWRCYLGIAPWSMASMRYNPPPPSQAPPPYGRTCEDSSVFVSSSSSTGAAGAASRAAVGFSSAPAPPARASRAARLSLLAPACRKGRQEFATVHPGLCVCFARTPIVLHHTCTHPVTATAQHSYVCSAVQEQGSQNAHTHAPGVAPGMCRNIAHSGSSRL